MPIFSFFLLYPFFFFYYYPLVFCGNQKTNCFLVTTCTYTKRVVLLWSSEKSNVFFSEMMQWCGLPFPPNCSG